MKTASCPILVVATPAAVGAAKKVPDLARRQDTRYRETAHMPWWRRKLVSLVSRL